MNRPALVLVSACLLAACGATPSPAPPGAPVPPANAPAVAPPETAPSAAPIASAAPAETPGAEGGSENAFAAHLEEEKAAKELGGDHGKLLAIAKVSPKTHRALLKSYLFRPLSECSGQSLVEVKPAPGLLVAGGKPVQVRAKAYENLVAASALAKQRGMAIEVVAGHETIKSAVSSWNHAIIDTALLLAKAAPPAEAKEKSYATEARKIIDTGEGPRAWTTSPCDTGRLGGWAVDVQLVTLDPSGAKDKVMVKSGPDGDRFTRETFEATYWDKPKGKSFRVLTEVMSAGNYVRQCSEAFHFTTSKSESATWRCRQDTESWDPPNRPLPAWQ